MSAISAIVLAGNKKGAKAIRHENKAFLEFDGEPLVVHVLRALLQAEKISGIVVVGPKNRLEAMLESAHLQGKESIVVVEQLQNLLENGKAGYIHALGVDYTPSAFNELRQTEKAEIPALFASCDIPLVTPWEIDEMVRKADLANKDYSAGLTRATIMKAYLPRAGKPGIRMANFHVAEGLCRHNNLHIAKPLKFHRLVFIEHMYLSRYQKKFTNMFRVMMSFLFVGRWTFRTIRLYLGLQIARTLYIWGKRGRLYERIRSTNRIQSVSECLGGIMDMKMECIFTSYGGAVLDVDNAKDLEVAVKMKDEWLEHQREIYLEENKAK